MAKRVCSKPNCGTLINIGAYRNLCPTHQRDRDRDRGTPTQRGYGTEHQALRKQWQSRIDAGETITCATCPNTITGRLWHLGHNADRSGYLGPQCIQCNLTEAGRASHQR